MENEYKVLTILKRNVFPGINLFELILFIFGTTIGWSLFIWQTTVVYSNGSVEIINTISYVISLIDIPMGILAATWLSKKNKWAPLLLAFDALLYGSANFLAGNIALGVANAIVTPMLWLFAMFYLWPKQNINDNNEIETRKLNLKTGFSLVGLILIIAISVGLIQLYLTPGLNELSDQQIFKKISIWFDSFAAVIMVSAVVMGVFRFRETWYLYFMANFLKIILFSVALSLGNMEDLLLIVIAIIYFLNAVFGMIIWKSSKQISIKK